MELPQPGKYLDNHLLAGLPIAQFNILLRPHLKTTVIPQGTVLLEAGDEFETVYFPHNGMISLLVMLEDGKSIEVATVGREGVVGAMAGLGLYRSLVRVVVQLSMSVSTLSATQYRRATTNSQAIGDLCVQYNEVLLSQARIVAACNAAHGIESRLCRWLLQSADRAESDVVPLTQEFLAEMLGTRRTSVTDAAVKLQDLGAIKYARGVIHILDRSALEGLSCECYQSMVTQAALVTIENRDDFIADRTPLDKAI